MLRLQHLHISQRLRQSLDVLFKLIKCCDIRGLSDSLEIVSKVPVVSARELRLLQGGGQQNIRNTRLVPTHKLVLTDEIVLQYFLVFIVSFEAFINNFLIRLFTSEH